MSCDALRTLSADDLAAVLHRSVATILSDLSRRPQNLPPSITVGKTRVWLESSVLEWLKARESNTPIGKVFRT